MHLELLTIGDELLLGFTVDTNGAHIARELATLGVGIVRRTSVSDDAEAITAAVREALDRTGAVITTGGLGPTADDLTRPAIAALFGRALRFDERHWERLREIWRERGRPGELPESNRVQAEVPEGADVLPNAHGTAPGLWLEDDRGRWVAMVPGVPREMRLMLAEQVIPRLRRRIPDHGAVIRSRAVRTTGVAESQLPGLLGEMARGVDGLTLAYLPSPSGVDLRLTARGLGPDAADAALERGIAKLHEAVSRYAYGRDDEDLAAVVLECCRAKGLRLALAESCTGGLLGARLTAIPRSSDVLLGGVIAYANAVKVEQLGVRPETLAAVGAVSQEVAREMATGARARLGSDIGVGITGIAGPGGAVEGKPVGHVCIAVDDRGTLRSLAGNFIGDRAEIRYRATQAALDMIRRSVEA
jgi:nicotinamide-nucleotide amidase